MHGNQSNLTGREPYSSKIHDVLQAERPASLASWLVEPVLLPDPPISQAGCAPLQWWMVYPKQVKVVTQPIYNISEH